MRKQASPIDDRILATKYRGDNWVNFITGMGTPRYDKRLGASFKPSALLGEEELNAIYMNEGMGCRIIDVLTEDMTRVPFEIKGDTDADMQKELKKFNGRRSIIEATKWALLHGGAVGVIGVDDGGFYDEPVDEGKIVKITHVHVFDRWRTIWTTADLYSDPMNPKYATPEFYTIFPINPAMTAAGSAFGQQVQSGQIWGRAPQKAGQGAGYSVRSGVSPAVGAFRVHESRIMRFDGTLVPLKERIRNRYWNISYLQSCYERIRGLGEAYGGLETIISEFLLGTLKIDNLMNLIASNKEAIAQKRLDFLDRTKSILNTMLLDKEEEYERKGAPVSGLSDLMDRLVLGISNATGIPEVVLFGKSLTGGLSNSGDVNLRRYYDKIAAMQALTLEEPLNKLCRYVMLSKESEFGGKELKDWSLEFPTLWAMTKTEEATVRKVIADTDATYINAGVLTPEEVAKSRFGGESYSTDTKLSEDRDPETGEMAIDLKPPNPLNPVEVMAAMAAGGQEPAKKGEKAPAGVPPSDEEGAPLPSDPQEKPPAPEGKEEGKEEAGEKDVKKGVEE